MRMDALQQAISHEESGIGQRRWGYMHALCVRHKQLTPPRCALWHRCALWRMQQLRVTGSLHDVSKRRPGEPAWVMCECTSTIHCL